MFTTLSAPIQRPRGCLEIECLFDRAMRGQTTKRFSGPPENRTRWPRRRPSTPKVTTLREIETVNQVRLIRGPAPCEKSPTSQCHRKVTVLRLGFDEEWSAPRPGGGTAGA